MTQASFLDSHAWGLGLATIANDGTILDVWYPKPALGSAPTEVEASAELAALVGKDERRRVSLELVKTEVNLAEPVAGTADAYLRLHLLSHLIVKPNTINLDGLIPNLPIVAFTNVGPIALDDLEQLRPTLTRQASASMRSISSLVWSTM